ncbi:MAG: CYTH and CHAD domain-containing protein, partial [Xanthobacteraceae bacterium]
MHGTTPGPHKEIEVKLELAPASLRDFKKIPLLRTVTPAGKAENQVSVYFDTENQRLRKNGLMLRVRRHGRHYRQTIKAAVNSGSIERDEWEAEIAGKRPDLDQADGTALEPHLTGKVRRRLKPLFETRVSRTVYPVVANGHAIALTLDRGTIETGTRSLPLCEIELELKRGTAADLFDVARTLTQSLPARLAVKSKSQRGYELIDGEQEGPVKATHVELLPGILAREACRIVGLACLNQIVSNDGALNKGDPEGVHQMRVGLRRLRAAMSLFAELLRDAQTAGIKNELKWLAGELGPARELEVLIRRVVTPVKRQRRRWRGMPSLSREIAERRDAALGRAQAAVQSARFRSLTLEVAAWLEAGLWTKPQDDLKSDRGDLPIEEFAFEQLARRWRKVRKRGRMLAKLDPRRRHKLRIQTKKLRYASEFFATLFTSRRAVKRRKQFLPALERLQDALGDLNDIAVHEKRIAAMGVRHRR